MSYKFGVSTVGSTGWLMQNVSTGTSAQEALGLDESGETAVAHYYQKTKNVTIEAIIPEGETVPVAGNTFTFGGETYYVIDATVTESNTDFQKLSLTCKRFTSASLPASASV